MNKIVTLVTCAAFLTSFQVRADEGFNESEPSDRVTEVSTTAIEAAEPTETAEVSVNETDDVKYVGKAPEKKERDNTIWTKFVIAGTAIAVAVISLVCVSKNKGKRA